MELWLALKAKIDAVNGDGGSVTGTPPHRERKEFGE